MEFNGIKIKNWDKQVVYEITYGYDAKAWERYKKVYYTTEEIKKLMKPHEKMIAWRMTDLEQSHVLVCMPNVYNPYTKKTKSQEVACFEFKTVKPLRTITTKNDRIKMHKPIEYEFQSFINGFRALKISNKNDIKELINAFEQRQYQYGYTWIRYFKEGLNSIYDMNYRHPIYLKINDNCIGGFTIEVHRKNDFGIKQINLSDLI